MRIRVRKDSRSGDSLECGFAEEMMRGREDSWEGGFAEGRIRGSEDSQEGGFAGVRIRGRRIRGNDDSRAEYSRERGCA